MPARGRRGFWERELMATASIASLTAPGGSGTGSRKVPGVEVVRQSKTEKGAAVVHWNHACFGIRGVSKRTGSNPVHGPSVSWASSLGATVS
ncbi:hypothetical protein E2C01_045747 [Portunus trituberculatus]|uniref:Uncharacterized protein n=1 Tax=Portunus trituberculatus TaxID=210409 RepID=A0A5B7FWK9_PORTR|nr:hypothetical protein [Portunus trituberculatus]